MTKATISKERVKNQKLTLLHLIQGRSQRLHHVEAHQKMENYGYFTFHKGNNKGIDQTAQMCRLVCAFIVRKQKIRVSGIEAHMLLKPRLPGLRACHKVLLCEHVGASMRVRT